MLKAAGDFIKTEIFGNAVHAPWPCIGFKGPNQQLARIIFIIAAIIIVAQHGQRIVYPLYAFKQNIIMFARMQGGGHANACRQIARPHAAADHNIIGINRSIIGIDTRHTLPIMANFCDLGVLKNLRAAGACALRKRLRNVHGIGIAIARDMNTADHVIHIDDMGEFFDLLRRHDMDGQIKYLRHRSAAFQLFKPLRIGRHRNGAALAIACGLAGFSF